MVEATIGTVLLLFAALGAIQLILVFHGALAAHSAATRSARAMALTFDHAEAERVFRLQKATSLSAINWIELRCYGVENGAECQVRAEVPSILPGSGLFFGSITSIPIRETGYYPNFERSN